MEFFRRKKDKRPDAFPYPIKSVSIAPPPSPRMKVQAALNILNEEGAYYDVTFMGTRYQRLKSDVSQGIGAGPQ